MCVSSTDSTIDVDSPLFFSKSIFFTHTHIYTHIYTRTPDLIPLFSIIMTMEYTPAFFDSLFDAIAPHVDELLKQYAPPVVPVLATEADAINDPDIAAENGYKVLWAPNSSELPSTVLLDTVKKAVIYRLTREILTNPRARGGFVWTSTSETERRRQRVKRENKKNMMWERVVRWLKQDSSVFKKKKDKKKSKKNRKDGTPIPVDEVEELGQELVKMVDAHATIQVDHLLNIAAGKVESDGKWDTDSDRQSRLPIVKELYDGTADGVSIQDRIKTAESAMAKLDAALKKSEKVVDPDHDPASVFASKRAAELLLENESTWIVWILVDVWRNGGAAFSVPSDQ